MLHGLATLAFFLLLAGGLGFVFAQLRGERHAIRTALLGSAARATRPWQARVRSVSRAGVVRTYRQTRLAA